MRRSGLQLVGNVPWGTHFCQFYQDRQDLLEILVSYFRHGLEDNEYCMWVTSQPLDAREACNALRRAVPDLDDRIRRGQIEFLDYQQWYKLDGRFDADRVLKGWVQRERAALQRGFAGLRLTGTTFWLEKSDWRDFREYEAAVDNAIGAHRMLALCTYSVDKCRASEILDVVHNHEFALMKQEGKWELIHSKRAHEKIRQQNAVLEGINRIFREAFTCDSEEQLGRVCLQVAEDVTGSEFGFVGEINAEGRLDNIAISDPAWAACRTASPTGHRTVPGGFKIHGIYGRVLADGKSLFTNDPSSHPDSIGTPAGHPALTAFLGVPLIHGGKTIGMVGVGNRQGGYRAGDQAALESLAAAMVQALMRQRGERALQENREWLRVTLTSIGDAVIATDAQARITFLNPVAATLTGWSVEQALGQPVAGVFRTINEKTRQPAADVVRRALTEESVVSLANQTALVARDGREIPIEDSAAPILDVAGNVSGAVLVFQDVTAKRRAQEELRRGSEQRRLSLEAAELGTWEYHFDTGEVLWDERCRAMFGLPEGTQADYADVIACIHPDYRAGVDKAVQAALACANDGGYHHEFPVCWRDGSIHWIASYGRVYFEGEGPDRRPVRFIGANRDITQRRNENEELRRLNRTLKAHSSSDQAILRATQETQFVREVCRIIVEDCGHAMVCIGYAENDERKTVRPVAYAGFEEGYINSLGITWADTERGRGPTGTAIRTGQPCICRNMLTDLRFEPWRAEARKRGYAASIAVPLMAGGKAFGALTIYCREPDPFSDSEVRLLCDLADDLAYGITALRLREAHARAEALVEAGRRSLERERNLLQAVMNGARNSHLVYLDTNFNFVRVNEAYARTCGYAPDQMIGKNHFDLYPHAENEAIFARVRDTGEAVEFHDKPFVFPDQPQRGITYWDWTLVPVKGEAGRVEGLIFSLTETTERKRAEEALRLSEEGARQRAEELERLKAALEQASAAKDRFIAALSHELRTPLTPVLAATESLLRDPRLPKDLRDDLAMVHRNAGLEVALINDLLDVTRIAAGKLVLEKRPLDAAQLIRETAKICAPELQARGQMLSIDAPDAAYLIEGDAARLHQVFWNLIRNAIKFTPPQGAIAVKTLAGDGMLRVSVSDNGIGIEPAAVSRLFKAFEQADHGRRFGGLGLGLAIAKGVVEAHGGRISAHSDGRDKGAAFTVELPLLHQPQQRTSDATPAAQAATEARQALRILLVEDHRDTARIMARLLKRCGHEVTTAADIGTALSHAGRHEFELLISDLGLPDGSGLDLMRALRQRGYQTPGIALTGYGQEDDLRRTQEAGFAMHLTKPINFEQLEQAISQVFAK